MNRPTLHVGFGAIAAALSLLAALPFVGSHDIIRSGEPEGMPSVDGLSIAQAPRYQTSRRFAAQEPRAKGGFIRVLPGLEPTGHSRNAGQIRSLGFGRRRLYNRRLIRLAGQVCG